MSYGHWAAGCGPAGTGKRGENALTAARTAGWDWPKTARFVFRMLLDPAVEPFELTHAARRPEQRPADRGDEHTGAELARRMFAQRHQSRTA